MILKVHTWTAIEVFFSSDFFWIFFILQILLASDIQVLLLLYETVLCCNNEPDNLENDVWIAEFYPGYQHILHRLDNE